MTAISVRGLRKSFGDHLVLDGIDFDVAEGTAYALLGPNGAGKTTTIQILTTLISADGGSVRDDDALTRQVPSEGGVRRLREVLDRLDTASVEVDGLSLHTPDLDDVFLALTGQIHHAPASRAAQAAEPAATDREQVLR